MKLTFRYLILIGLFFPFILLSCTTVPNAASLEALANARTAAEEARSKAEYVDGSTYCPEEWGLAEDRYSAAKAYAAPETKKEATTQTGEWKGLNVAYQDIYGKSIPQFAGEQQKRLTAAREEAVKAGADDLVPEHVAKADEYSDSSKSKLEKNDFAGSIRDGKEALDRYKVLQTIAEAHNKQEEADNNNFFSVDADNYMLAAEAGNNAVDLYDKNQIPESQEAAEEALDRFTQVVKNGWVYSVEEKASVAKEWRDASQEVKADVAVKQEYDAADRVYNNAHVALRAEEYAVAAELFEQSGGLFSKAHDNALIKRERAEEALRDAELKLAESEKKAQTAQELFGGE